MLLNFGFMMSAYLEFQRAHKRTVGNVTLLYVYFLELSNYLSKGVHPTNNIDK